MNLKLLYFLLSFTAIACAQGADSSHNTIGNTWHGFQRLRNWGVVVTVVGITGSIFSYKWAENGISDFKWNRQTEEDGDKIVRYELAVFECIPAFISTLMYLGGTSMVIVGQKKVIEYKRKAKLGSNVRLFIGLNSIKLAYNF